jgi:ABC-type multidrug transport system permease subunit
VWQDVMEYVLQENIAIDQLVFLGVLKMKIVQPVKYVILTIIYASSALEIQIVLQLLLFVILLLILVLNA